MPQMTMKLERPAASDGVDPTSRWAAGAGSRDSTSPRSSDRAAQSKSAASSATVSSASAPTMVFKSDAMARLWSAIKAVAQRGCTAMIHGESGTGKELVARQLHAQSNRANQAFVAVDCTTLHDSMMESQLFGHVKGSFTGANESTVGFFRSAEGGTIFLDEIAELPLRIQAKLLRVLQERSVVPLGGVEAIPVDVRIVAATHRDLDAMVKRGEFREDLYYRLNVVQLRVPALRDRIEDIEALARYSLGRLAETYGEKAKGISPEALAALQGYDWPGNVRELFNAIEHASVFCDVERIAQNDLPDKVRKGAGSKPVVDAKVLPLEVFERNHIARALRETSGNKAQAARLLGMLKQRLGRKIKEHDLEGLLRK